MNISIADIPVVYISPNNNDKYKLRKTKTETLLQTMGFKDITHHQSTIDKYPRCLAKANIDILARHLDDNPLLIVEDDIASTGLTNITMPINADCFYAGHSWYAGNTTENTNGGRSQIVHIKEGVYKVENMLSTHAIIYISKRFKEAAIECFQLSYDKEYHMDVILSRILSKYSVYANSMPVFYQNDETSLGNSKATMIRFDKYGEFKFF